MDVKKARPARMNKAHCLRAQSVIQELNEKALAKRQNSLVLGQSNATNMYESRTNGFQTLKSGNHTKSMADSRRMSQSPSVNNDITISLGSKRMKPLPPIE